MRSLAPSGKLFKIYGFVQRLSHFAITRLHHGQLRNDEGSYIIIAEFNAQRAAVAAEGSITKDKC
eukprot:8906-Heterococcus_DN1.PRE.2